VNAPTVRRGWCVFSSNAPPRRSWLGPPLIGVEAGSTTGRAVIGMRLVANDYVRKFLFSVAAATLQNHIGCLPSNPVEWSPAVLTLTIASIVAFIAFIEPSLRCSPR